MELHGLCPASGGKYNIFKRTMVISNAYNLPSSMSTDRKLQIAPALVHFCISFSYWGQNMADLIRWNNSFVKNNDPSPLNFLWPHFFIFKGVVSSYQIGLILPSVAETQPKMYQSRCNLQFSICRHTEGKVISIENHHNLFKDILFASTCWT